MYLFIPIYVNVYVDVDMKKNVLYPRILFSRRPNAKLTEIKSILLPCRTIFRKSGNMPPPKVPPLHSGGSRGGRYATGACMQDTFARATHSAAARPSARAKIWYLVYNTGACIQDTLSSRAFRPSASREQRYLAYNTGAGVIFPTQLNSSLCFFDNSISR